MVMDGFLTPTSPHKICRFPMLRILFLYNSKNHLNYLEGNVEKCLKPHLSQVSLCYLYCFLKTDSTVLKDLGSFLACTGNLHFWFTLKTG